MFWEAFGVHRVEDMITLIVWNFELKERKKEWSGYEAVAQLTHRPRQCFVKLRCRGGYERIM
jgi:hypothetical protein